MTDFVGAYLAVAMNVLEKIARQSAQSFHRAAEAVADALQQDKAFFVYGIGHSALIARDEAGRPSGARD
jgi:uncharacterized phosphosugar-binding protein